MVSKKLRFSEEKQAEDRLSNLPADILTHIVSFLPTKIAATTSVLSKRWKFLFHSISHIDLDEAWQNYPSNRPIKHWALRKSFYKFVYDLLLSPHSSHINSLRLRYSIVPDHQDPTHNWIVVAIQRHVEQLTLLVNTSGMRILPVEIFNCKTIRVLRIHRGFYFTVPSWVNMPNLVELHLKHVKFINETCFDKISSKLKHLSLSLCSMNSSNKVIHLVSQSLTNLILRSGIENYRIVLCTPNLVCLDYKAYEAYGPAFLTVTEKMNCLTSVDVNFQVPEEDYMVTVAGDQLEIVLPYGELLNKFIENIDKVKFLRLSGYSLKALCFSTCRLPTFHNLTSMELSVNHRVGWQLIAKLLESSPNLEVLNFDKGFIDQSSIGCIIGKLEFEYCVPERVPMCLLENLRHIKVGDFSGGKCEFELIGYFLRSGKVLEEIKIFSQTFSEWSSSFCEILLGYPKCSKTCKIVVCWKADGNLCQRCIN